MSNLKSSLRKKSFFLSVFSFIRTEYENLLVHLRCTVANLFSNTYK